MKWRVWRVSSSFWDREKEREREREREGKSLTAFSDILNFFEKSFFWETIES